MLNENIKAVRKNKGLSQEELAIKLNVVRQTVSKWERGLSVPDSEMLISISDVLETPVSVLLGETIAKDTPDSLQALAEKLEIINLQLAQQKETGRKILHGAFIVISAVVAIVFMIMILAGSPYLKWNYADPETAVAGTALHAFEWVFVRIAPFMLIGTIIGAVMTRKKN